MKSLLAVKRPEALWTQSLHLLLFPFDTIFSPIQKPTNASTQTSGSNFSVSPHLLEQQNSFSMKAAMCSQTFDCLWSILGD